MVGVILINTGSPSSPEVNDVAAYLCEFLMDERVIDIPKPFRYLLVKSIIVPFRKHKSAKSYRSIWTSDGSPLVVNAFKLAKKVESISGSPCEVAMRYGYFSVKDAYFRLMERYPNVNSVVVLPLFPHYAMSSYESVVQHAAEQLGQIANAVRYRVVLPFYSHPLYIAALVKLFERFRCQEYDRVLFTYHSIPARHIKKVESRANLLNYNDVDYHRQVNETSRLVAEKVGFAENFDVAFQSAMGKSWLMPSTLEVLRAYPSKGIKRVLVMSPSFVADNLETLKDVVIEGQEAFIAAGGEIFTYVPCLNFEDDWANALVEIAKL